MSLNAIFNLYGLQKLRLSFSLVINKYSVSENIYSGNLAGVSA